MFHLKIQAVRLDSSLIVQALVGMIGKMLKERDLARL